MSPSAERSPETWLLAGLPALATLFEGGASVVGLVLWHGTVALLVIAALLRPGPRTGARSLASPIRLAWLAFLAIVVVGCLLAPYGYAAWLNAVELAAVTAVLLLAGRHGPGLARLAAWPLGGVAAAQAILALVQRIGGQPRPAGTFLDPNHLGGFLVAVLLLLAGEAISATDRRRRVAALALGAPLIPALLVSGSRGALLAGLAGAAWLMLGAWRRLTPRRRVVVVAAIAVVATPVVLRVAQRLQDTDPYRFHRVKIWRASLETMADRPLLGTGPGQFALAAEAHQFDDGHPPLRFDRAFRVTHSDAVRVVAEFGIPAAVVALLGLGLFVREVRRGAGGPAAVASPGPVAALVAIGAQALVDNPSRWPALYLLASLLAACLVSRAAPVLRRPSPAVRGALAAVVALVFVVGELGPSIAWLKARELPQGRLDPRRLEVLDLVTLLNPIQPEFAQRRVDHLLAGEGSLSLETYVEAREAAEHAVRLSPRDSRYHWGLARVEGQACLGLFQTVDSRDRTYEHLERAQQLSPTDARIPLDAAEFGLAAGDLAYARRMAERGLTLEPRAVAGHLTLARVLIEEGPAGRTRAAELLARAEALADEAAAAGFDSGYARELSALDAAKVAALRERVLVAGGSE